MEPATLRDTHRAEAWAGSPAGQGAQDPQDIPLGACQACPITLASHVMAMALPAGAEKRHRQGLPLRRGLWVWRRAWRSVSTQKGPWEWSPSCGESHACLGSQPGAGGGQEAEAAAEAGMGEEGNRQPEACAGTRTGAGRYSPAPRRAQPHQGSLWDQVCPKDTQVVTRLQWGP